MNGYSKNQVEEAINSSDTISEVLTKLNYSKGSAAYSQFLRYSAVNNLNISKLLIHQNNTGGRRTALEIKDIAIENSSCSRKVIRSKILKLGLKKYECQECGHPPLWKGKEIHLILDHINGVNNDHRLENLRFLCPMCNATLETHGGKNRRTYKICKECDKKYHSSSEKFCSKSCFGKYNARLPKKDRRVERPDYATLILEIEQTNYSSVARKYGVSDNSIRKWVKYYEKHGNVSIKT